MPVKINAPSFIPGVRDEALESDAQSVRDAIDQLIGSHPNLRKHLLDEQGELRHFLNIYLNDEDIRYLDGLDTPLGQNDVISIVPAIAGGPGTNIPGAPYAKTMTASEPERPPSSPRVFLIYARADRAIAEEIAQALQVANFHVWFDSWELQPGDSIATRIREGVSASDFLVVLLSPDSANSRWVGEELTLALSNELRQRAISVVPTILRDCDVPQALQGYPLVDLRNDGPTAISLLVEKLALARDVDFSRLDPRRFEELVADMFRAEGFSVNVTMATIDGGHDIVLTKTPAPSEGENPLIYVVQIKHYKERRVSVDTIRSAIGAIVLAGQNARGLIVSSSQLTSAAQAVISDVNRRGRFDLEVIDGPELVRRVVEHPDVVAKYFRPGSET